MKEYNYTGLADHNATIRHEGEQLDIRLSKGQAFKLPGDHPHIKYLLSAGLLVEAETISQ